MVVKVALYSSRISFLIRVYSFGRNSYTIPCSWHSRGLETIILVQWRIHTFGFRSMYIFVRRPIQGGADKSLACPGRKQATATKFRIYSTNSIHGHQLQQEIIWIMPNEKNSKSPSDDWHRWLFWAAFRHFGTHFAETKFSWMMDPTHSREMPSCSAVDLAEIQLAVFQD
jgi:hypothetical protein